MSYETILADLKKIEGCRAAIGGTPEIGDMYADYCKKFVHDHAGTIAVLAAARPLPSDWVAVPRDPVAALPILHALADEAGLQRLPDPGNPEDAYPITGAQSTVLQWYKAMLAAAPSAPAEGGECTGCSGNGEVGGLTPTGYESDTCPHCKGSGKETAPEPLAQGEVFHVLHGLVIQWKDNATHSDGGQWDEGHNKGLIRCANALATAITTLASTKLYASPQPAAEGCTCPYQEYDRMFSPMKCAQDEIDDLRAELARIEENGTPWVPELLEWLEKHDCCPELPFTDYELIESLEARFGTKPPAAWPLNTKPETGWTFDPDFIEEIKTRAEQSDAGEFAPCLEGVESVLIALRDMKAPNPPQPSASVGVPHQECYSSDFDTWFDSPDDSAFVDGLKVGDTYKLQVSHYSIEREYVVTKVPDDTNDDYEVRPVIESALTAAAGGGSSGR